MEGASSKTEPVGVRENLLFQGERPLSETVLHPLAVS